MTQSSQLPSTSSLAQLQLIQRQRLRIKNARCRQRRPVCNARSMPTCYSKASRSQRRKLTSSRRPACNARSTRTFPTPKTKTDMNTATLNQQEQEAITAIREKAAKQRERQEQIDRLQRQVDEVQDRVDRAEQTKSFFAQRITQLQQLL